MPEIPPPGEGRSHQVAGRSTRLRAGLPPDGGRRWGRQFLANGAGEHAEDRVCVLTQYLSLRSVWLYSSTGEAVY